jgi:hypothetical protein
MAESNTASEIAELRQAMAALHLDLLVHKGFAGSARCRAERGVDVALDEFKVAARVLADTPWGDGARAAVETVGEALAGYHSSIASFDSTRENLYRTLLIESIWELKSAVFSWPRERQVHVKEGKA